MPDPEEEKKAEILRQANQQGGMHGVLGKYKVRDDQGKVTRITTKPFESGKNAYTVYNHEGNVIGHAVSKEAGGTSVQIALYNKLKRKQPIKGSYDYVDPKTGEISAHVQAKLDRIMGPTTKQSPSNVAMQKVVDNANNDKDVLTNIKGQVEDVTEIE